MDKGNIAIGVFVDFQKAFDTVNHKILLSKLEHYGIRGIASSWFSSYLFNRQQYVSIGGINSETKPIMHGVKKFYEVNLKITALGVLLIAGCPPTFLTDSNMFQ